MLEFKVQPLPSAEEVRRLTDAVRAAHKEMCERNECQCVTDKEHQRMLAS